MSQTPPTAIFMAAKAAMPKPPKSIMIPIRFLTLSYSCISSLSRTTPPMRAGNG